MKAITISIGRNIGEAPMTDAAWASFRANVRDILTGTLVEPFIGETLGVSKWEGVREECCTFVGSGEPRRRDVEEEIRHEVALLAERFCQDAIFCAVAHLGDDDGLVEPPRDARTMARVSFLTTSRREVLS